MNPDPSELAELSQQDTPEVDDISADLEVRECEGMEAVEAPETAHDDFLERFGGVRSAFRKLLETQRNTEIPTLKNCQKFLEKVEGVIKRGEKKEALKMLEIFIGVLTTYLLNHPHNDEKFKAMFIEVVEVQKSICHSLDIPEPDWFKKIRKLKKGQNPDPIDTHSLVFGSSKIEEKIRLMWGELR